MISNIKIHDKDYNPEFDLNETEPVNVPCDETLLQPNVLIFAPGEGEVPLSVMLDTDAESMIFFLFF